MVFPFGGKESHCAVELDLFDSVSGKKNCVLQIFVSFS